MTKFFRTCGILLVFLVSGTSFLPAATGDLPPIDRTDTYNPQGPIDNSRFFGEFLYTLFVLGCVIGVMILASWFIRRMMQTRVQQLNQSSVIKISETRTLGPKSVLHIVEVHGTSILISETPAGVTPLAKFKTDSAFVELMDKDSRKKDEG